jgi:hypothetical protein
MRPGGPPDHSRAFRAQKPHTATRFALKIFGMLREHFLQPPTAARGQRASSRREIGLR